MESKNWSMKNSTKYKIIKWVERMLGYKHSMPNLEVETRKIKTIQWRGRLNHNQIKYDLKNIIGVAIAEELIKNQVIEFYTRRIDDDQNDITGKIYFIEPFTRISTEDMGRQYRSIDELQEFFDSQY